MDHYSHMHLPIML